MANDLTAQTVDTVVAGYSIDTAATVTEVMRVALANGWKPKRTVVFAGYAAEEVGLRGSDAVARSFKAPHRDSWSGTSRGMPSVTSRVRAPAEMMPSPYAAAAYPSAVTEPTAAATHEPSAGRQHDGLRRELTSRQVAMIGLSGALGTGLFLGSGSMIAIAGPAIIVSYVLTGLAALAIVWALAEMTVVHPVAGGFGTISRAYVGPIGGWVARWNVAVTMCIAVGAEVVAATSYLRYWFPSLSMGVGTAVLSAAIVAVNLAAVHLYGASEYWFSLVKVVTVVAFVVLGVVLVVAGLPGHAATGLSNLTAHGGFAPFGITGVLTGAVLALFSFGGTENVSVAAAESEHPERDVPRAARAMILRLVLFYVLAIAVVVTIAPWTVSAASHGSVTESPFVTVLDAVGVPAAADVMNAVLITAALSAANGCLFAASRMIHALALDSMAPRALAVTSANGSPRRAVAASAIGMLVACVLAITSPDSAFMTLFGVNVFGLMITWTIVLVTYLGFRRLRARHGLPASPVHLAGGPLTAGLLLVLIAVVVVSLAFIEPLQIGLRAGIPYALLLLAAFAVNRAVTRGRAERPTVLDEELERR